MADGMRCTVEFETPEGLLVHAWSVPAAVFTDDAGESWFATVFGFFTRGAVRDLRKLVRGLR